MPPEKNIFGGAVKKALKTFVKPKIQSNVIVSLPPSDEGGGF